MASRLILTAALAAAAAGRTLQPRADGPTVVNRTTCNGKEYVYEELAGYGFVPWDAVDKFGDTLAGLGSSIHIDRKSWTKDCDGTYTGTLWSIPDRGWNTEGTLNFRPRIHKFTVSFTTAEHATVSQPSKPNLNFKYEDSIALSGPDGTPCTGIDADVTGHLSYPGFPDLPVATITGDGFGGDGPKTQRIPIDCEGLVVNEDGSFWISDEYGPNIYLFDLNGKMAAAIRPPEAIVPYRNGAESFSSARPPKYLEDREGALPDPEHPESGRDNNNGLEGLTVSEDGKTLYALLQAAIVQEGGSKKKTQRYARLLSYDISNPLAPAYKAEHVVPLPLYSDPTAKPSKNPRAAGQSEIQALANGQFLVLARDEDAGRGQANTLSAYRQVDVFDVSRATDVRGERYDARGGDTVATEDGVLNAGIEAAEYCAGFIDFNVNSQLGRFGLHNGGEQDAGLLNEKWESISVVPVDPENPEDDEYFVFSLSDNDFIVQDGRLNNGEFRYADSSGYNLDNQALVFKVRIPS